MALNGIEVLPFAAEQDAEDVAEEFGGVVANIKPDYHGKSAVIPKGHDHPFGAVPVSEMSPDEVARALEAAERL